MGRVTAFYFIIEWFSHKWMRFVRIFKPWTTLWTWGIEILRSFLAHYFFLINARESICETRMNKINSNSRMYPGRVSGMFIYIMHAYSKGIIRFFTIKHQFLDVASMFYFIGFILHFSILWKMSVEQTPFHVSHNIQSNSLELLRTFETPHNFH